MSEDRLKVLVVDDEPRIVKALSRLLKPNYEVYQAESGEVALEIIRCQQIHVIVSDQRMPKMTGSELLAKVKLISPNTIRILLTGYSDLSAVIESVNQGEIFRYITKPWRNDAFLATVKQASEIAEPLFKNGISAMTSAKETQSQEKTERVNKKVLVVEKKTEVVQILNQVLNNRVECFTSSSLQEASKIMMENDINLILMNISLDNREALAFIKMVKAENPHSLCLVVADNADINHVTSLINEGQIYRFISKPMRKGQLKMFMISAIRYCKQLADRPELLTKHVVENISNKEEKKIANSFNSLLNSFRQKFNRLLT